jgi:hypothetical protein
METVDAKPAATSDVAAGIVHAIGNAYGCAAMYARVFAPR